MVIWHWYSANQVLMQCCIHSKSKYTIHSWLTDRKRVPLDLHSVRSVKRSINFSNRHQLTKQLHFNDFRIEWDKDGRLPSNSNIKYKLKFKFTNSKVRYSSSGDIWLNFSGSIQHILKSLYGIGTQQISCSCNGKFTLKCSIKQVFLCICKSFDSDSGRISVFQFKAIS